MKMCKCTMKCNKTLFCMNGKLSVQMLNSSQIFNSGPSGMITGNVSGPCMSGFYYVTSLPKTNLYLLIIENWDAHRASLFYNFNCQITRR